MRSRRVCQKLSSARRFLLWAGLGVLSQVTVGSNAYAEGSAQIGQIDPEYDGGLLAETVMLVDVLARLR